MKIARNLPVSGRYVEWYSPFPAPSLRELSSECETEGVYFVARKRSKISEPIMACGKTIGPVEPSDDTPSVTPFGRAGSLREGAGERSHSIDCSLKSGGGGRFSSPLRNSEVFTFHHSSDDTPSVTPLRACQLPQRGSREWGAYLSTGSSLKSGVAGDFHRPYENSECLTALIQRRTRPL